MLVGIWLDDPEEAFFDQIIIGIDHLLEWSRQSGIAVTDDDPVHARIGYRWERPRGDPSADLRLWARRALDVG